jgi:hypothetical protein
MEFKVSREVILGLLRRDNWIGPDDLSDEELVAAVHRYQAFHGLKVDGIVGPATIHRMTDPCRCGLPDQMADTLAMWPMKRVSFMSRLRLGLSNAGAIFAQAAQQWNDCSGIELFAASSANQANIVADDHSNPRDGFGQRGGVLADSGVPFNARQDTQIPQRYDIAEAWDDLMLLAVACHELGHAIGIVHLSAGNLMQPIFDRRITKPQAGDIAEVVRRYGPPKPKVPPTGGDPLEVKFEYSLTADWKLSVRATRGGETRKAAGTMATDNAVVAMPMVPGELS